MNAAETSASNAIADWTPLAVVSRSWTTAEIDTFISDVSTTSTNIAIASRIARRWSPWDSSATAGIEPSTVICAPANIIPREQGPQRGAARAKGSGAGGSTICRYAAGVGVDFGRARQRRGTDPGGGLSH
jgi:hypothetical protein